MKTGIFITFEGIDGSGKSTQASLLAQQYRHMGKTVVETREPGGSEGAEIIRRLLVEGQASRWSPESELLLFMAARRDHLEKVIQPALKKGSVVICDRYVDSTRVYQGIVRKNMIECVNMLHQNMIGVDPDLTFIIDSDPTVALSRGLARDNSEDRFEGFGLDFQIKLRAGFLDIAKKYTDRCHLIDGLCDPQTVAKAIYTIAKGY